MKISIIEVDKNEEEEIVIKCHQVNEEILALISKIRTSQGKTCGICGDKIFSIPVESIYYYETVDNKAFIYTKDNVYETKLKLYEFERQFSGDKFFRASKSTILNVSKIKYINPSLSGRFEATMKNGEKTVVSRQYVSDLKKMLGI